MTDETPAETTAPAPYKVRNQVARAATVILALVTLLPFAMVPAGYFTAADAASLVGATLWVWGTILISYVVGRVVETGVPMIWRR